METKGKKEPLRVWCKRCLRWLEHDTVYCPLFPKVAGEKKWSECCCLVHSCYDAKAGGIKRDKRTKETYRNFVEGDERLLRGL